MTPLPRLTRALCALALFLSSVTFAQAAPKSSLSGRRHLTRANQMASQGKCRSAIPEFSKAYQMLQDPAILFNRAECHRKLGDNRRAVEDYRTFLEELPTAPNRRSVEARITELAGGLHPPLPPPAAADPAPSTPAETRTELPASEPARQPFELPRARAAGPYASTRQEIAASDSPEPGKAAGGVPAWVWVGIGALLVGGGAVAGWYVFDRDHTDVPDSALGNFRF